ncbi:MAG: protease SohB [Bermanella sp.]
MEFLTEYGLFLAKSVTFLVVVALIVGLIASAGQKSKPSKIKITHLNKKYDALKKHLQEAVMDKKQLKQVSKDEKKARKDASSSESLEKVYVINFNGDIKASQSEQMKDEITALLSLGDGIDEIVVNVESGGGMVHQYGFAASQLERIKKTGIPLTVCVDKVAASGGYMMAVVADKIVAAPFAILGSIGVIAQLPNFNRLLKKNDIDFEVHTAGEYKRTLTVFGENTDKAREKFREDLADVHVMFKQFVGERRPVVDVEKVANGDVWYGQKALEVNLVDELKTSDEYLQLRCNSADVYVLSSEKKKTVFEKLGMAAQAGVSSGIESALQKMSFQKWFV